MKTAVVVSLLVIMLLSVPGDANGGGKPHVHTIHIYHIYLDVYTLSLLYIPYIYLHHASDPEFHNEIEMDFNFECPRGYAFSSVQTNYIFVPDPDPDPPVEDVHDSRWLWSCKKVCCMCVLSSEL